eukprot:6097327-Alexandrium_andersonii.AAC.1
MLLIPHAGLGPGQRSQSLADELRGWAMQARGRAYCMVVMVRRGAGGLPGRAHDHSQRSGLL